MNSTDPTTPSPRALAVIVLALGAVIEIVAIGLLVFAGTRPVSISVLALGTVITALGAVLFTRASS